MLKPYKIPAVLLFVTVALLAVGEIATGTRPFFALFMAGTLICIGITYNVLGGVSTIGGIAFAGFASCTIVISQFAKVILMEPADKTLESPELTIRVYFVFYLCALIGCFVYSRLRVRVLKPLEPKTPAQAQLQYGLSVSIGLVANLVYEVYESSPNPEQRASTAHSLGLAFSVLLLFSLVLAVQGTIRGKQGRHSFGFKAFVPWFATVFFGFIETSRSHIMLSSVVYIFTCYASGYKFRRKHYLAAAAGVAFLAFVVSPFEIYARGPMKQLEFRERLPESVRLVAELPDWSVVKEPSSAGVDSGSREEYFELPGTFVLSRLSAIRADSNMINACAGGYHYGFTALKMDVQRSAALHQQEQAGHRRRGIYRTSDGSQRRRGREWRISHHRHQRQLRSLRLAWCHRGRARRVSLGVYLVREHVRYETALGHCCRGGILFSVLASKPGCVARAGGAGAACHPSDVLCHWHDREDDPRSGRRDAPC